MSLHYCRGQQRCQNASADFWDNFTAILSFCLLKVSYAPRRMGLLNGRIAIVDRRPHGIGRREPGVCARRRGSGLRPRGATVDERVEAIAREPGRAVAVAAEVSTEAGARLMVIRAEAALGRVACLVNNAGDGGPTGPVQDYSLDDWLYTVNAHVTSLQKRTPFSWLARS
jgi:NAD(P)-dependent dehydrogenase (short-subunit alcohol dehydrogenase family)